MIVFEDESLVVCLKKRNFVSERGKENENSMVTLLEEKFKSEIFPVHRLDKPVGGLIVYAKNAETAASLSSQIQTGDFKKSYFAFVGGRVPEASARLEDLLFKDRKTNKTYVVKRKRAGVKRAELIYETVGMLAFQNTQCDVLKVTLITGRSHQIRVQFASRKLPLVGDRRYGSPFKHEPLELWSGELSFIHPQSGKRLSFFAAPSEEYLMSDCDFFKNIRVSGNSLCYHTKTD